MGGKIVRFVPLFCIREGMLLGQTLYTTEGSMLLKEGTILSRSYINKLKQFKFNGLYIKDGFTDDIEVQTVISQELRANAVSAVKSTFNTTTSKVKIKSMYNLALEIIDEILSNHTTVINMIDIKAYDDYTYYHCVNVAVLSALIGIKMRIPRNELVNLVLAGLLHDIGKVFIPSEIINKPSKLTDEEFEEIKKHPVSGYQYSVKMLKGEKKIGRAIKEHHEKYNGTGYPDGLPGYKISLFAKILSAADVYDALTSDRSYRKAMLPSDAMEFIYANNGVAFDPNVVDKFRTTIKPYPIGTLVMLSNGECGVVLSNTETNNLRPIIRLKDGSIINLTEDRSYLGVVITSILDNFPNEAESKRA